jgi:hypothetical protein
MVREFIEGRSFKNIDEARLRLAEINEVIARERAVIDNQIKGNYRPIEYTSDAPGIGVADKEEVKRLLDLSESLKNKQNQPSSTGGGGTGGGNTGAIL